MERLITRRGVLAGSAAVALSPLVRQLRGDDAKAKHVFQIGACDWSLGKRQDIASFDVAKAIGLDGVQFSFDNVGKPWDLRDATVREQVAGKSKETGVAVSSLAMGVLNRVPYASNADAERWVAECVETMAKMEPNPKVVLLAFFGAGDINGKRDLQDEVIARLKRVAPAAEKAGVVLGVESWMNVDDHRRMLDAVGSDAVKVYYDVANMTKMGYDINAEVRALGRDRICQFHCKENGYLLGRGKVDFVKLRDAITDIGYDGWLIIEGATERGKSMHDCYVHNSQYLRGVFNG